jgi:hypothetical protein
VTPRTVNRWIEAGRLRTIDLGALGRMVPKTEALDTERDTRQAARRGRPGARRRAGTREELAS